MSTTRQYPKYFPDQLRELLLRIPASPETDELQDFLTNYVRESATIKRQLAQRENQIKLVKEILHSPASNMRFMQIANPARQCLKILNTPPQ